MFAHSAATATSIACWWISFDISCFLTFSLVQVEYVTVLGPDKQVLISANKPRIGEVFNPEVRGRLSNSVVRCVQTVPYMPFLTIHARWQLW
jgi:hypothetical protein